MPSLTPADVRNVVFGRPGPGDRGYAKDEVDAFLRLAETELAALIGKGAELRNRADALAARAAEQAAPGSRHYDSRTGEPDSSMSVADTAAPGRGRAAATHDAQASKILGLAQEMADQLTLDARAEAHALLSEARAVSERLLSDSRSTSGALVARARTEAELTITNARAGAETVERRSRRVTELLTEEAERKHTEITNATRREQELAGTRIDELRAFEKQYRARLHDSITSLYAISENQFSEQSIA